MANGSDEPTLHSATENRSVGGSIPPLGTILKSLNNLAILALEFDP
jgi:hypothetical protein